LDGGADIDQSTDASLQNSLTRWIQIGTVKLLQNNLNDPVDDIMESFLPLQAVPDILKLLAHDLRWSMLQLLNRQDYRVHELAARLEEPTNLVSYHLRLLRAQGLLHNRRSEADGRDMYYSLDGARLHMMLQGALHDLEGTPSVISSSTVPVRVLFLCTHNSARSQMAEALLRHMGKRHVIVSSAGSHPTRIHPDALATMQSLEIPMEGQSPKHWSSVTQECWDYVITVCDQAREVCPTFPQDTQQLHWGYGDPAAISDPSERATAFLQTAHHLRNRIQQFMSQLGTSAA
jgi:ArsR family transcriptional regulator, arsenate/arsenite/antimonite-responsive transcriptional repressor / arsenate reductase (thioredoxin)